MIKQLTSEQLNKSIELNGWVLTIRNQKDISFIKLNDGSNSSGIQLVIDNVLMKDKIYTGCSINVKGILIKSPALEQDFEIQVSEINILGYCDPEEYPLAKGKLPLVYLRNYQHLRCRTITFGNIFRIKDAINYATHIFFHNKQYLHLDPNILTVNECEGGAGVFKVLENSDKPLDHFDKNVYLTVSSQLQLEALSCSLGAVYTTNKSFRSEHSSTNKHLSEFSHLEIENTFIDLEYLMSISEEYIKFIGNYLLENNLSDLTSLNSFVSKGLIDRITNLVNSEFIKLEYSNAIKLIKENSDIEINFGEDLSTSAENFLTDHYNKPVFVINWPCSIKSFYMKKNDDNITCANFDLLMPNKIGELIGGSMREDNYDKLINMMKNKNIAPNSLSFYTELRKFGSIPHGGFGLGLDRMCMLMTGVESIKDVVPFPVYYKNCEY